MGILYSLYIILYCLLIWLTLCTVGIWVTFVVTKIKRRYALYARAIKKLKANPANSGYFQILMSVHVHYSGLVKFGILLAIGIIGGLGITLVWIYELIPFSDLTLKQAGNNFTDIVDICEPKNSSFYKEQSNFSLYGLSEVFRVIPYCCFLLSVALCISLMKLISAQMMYADAWFGFARRSHYKWLIASIILNIIIISLTAIPYTRLFIRPIPLMLSILYLLYLYLSTRRLRLSLTCYARMRLKQFGENTKEKYQVKMFTYASTIVLTVYSILTLVMVIGEVQFYLASILYFGKCYIPFIYSIPYSPLITEQQQQITLFKINYYGTVVNKVFSVLCATLILTTLLIITFLMVARLLKQMIPGKKGSRNNVDALNQKLLPQE